MKYLLLIVGMTMTIAVGCKKNDKPPVVPTLTTTAAGSITTTTATSGGNITNTGGAEITASGVCYSKTNNMPTITDDTTKGTTGSGSFSSELKNLTPGTTYYIRAYAINSAGTGYGNVLSFMTGNAAPEAKAVTIAGNKIVGAALTIAYTYYDVESNPESGTTFQWYIANDTIGAAVTAISGATANTYTLVYADKDRFIRVGVTPKASAGTSPGTEAKSYWIGPIGGETVTFTYNGQSVTYGIIISAVTGKKWLDRNLGAAHEATDFKTDYTAKGDLFQWGRKDDGHQLVTRDPQTGATVVTGKITGPVTSITPGNKFVGTVWPQANWITPSDNTLWQAAGQINNPCPAGWHVPTLAEWSAENITKQTYFTQLKLTGTGYRGFDDGVITQFNSTGHYWMSTPFSLTDDPDQGFMNKYVVDDGGSFLSGDPRSTACAIRCIKD